MVPAPVELHSSGKNINKHTKQEKCKRVVRTQRELKYSDAFKSDWERNFQKIFVGRSLRDDI